VNVIPAYVRSSDICTQLVIRRLPPDVTAAEIREIFRPYSSKPDFPKVNITHVGSHPRAFITFLNHSRDASFALLMTRKCWITHPTTGERVMMIVDRASNR